MVPVPVLAFMHFGQVPVLARYITGTGIKWCPYRYWHLCILVQYQYWHGTLPVLAITGASTSIGILAPLSNTSIGIEYWHGTLPVLALNGARTGIGIYAFWSSTSIGIVYYRYWH